MMHDVNALALEAKRDVASLQESVRELEDRVDRQTLVLRALFTLLSESLAITDADLLHRVRKLAPPGGVYGRAVSQPQTCARCGASLGHRRNRCLACGEEWDVTSAFEFLGVESAAPPPAPPARQSSDKIH